MSFLDEYYNVYDEDNRLSSRHGQVEYLTTVKYADEYISKFDNPKIAEIGAGTGRYSVAYAKRGYDVTAVEPVEHNLEILRQKLDGSEKISVFSGNALDLSFLSDNYFDVTLMLGPMYHLFTREDKIKALSEAVRITKSGGFILVAYCMNEATVIQYAFGKNNLDHVLEAGLLTKDWHCKSEPKEIFELVRTEDISSYDAEVPVKRLKLIATDGATNYRREVIDSMDDRTFKLWLEYHFAICERQDLIGASHHTLDILQKL